MENYSFLSGDRNPHEYKNKELAEDEREDLFLRAHNGNEEARTRFVESSIQLVDIIVDKMPPKFFQYSMSKEDAKGYGILGVLDCIDNMNPERIGKVNLNGYLYKRIRGAIIDAFKVVETNLIRVPRSAYNTEAADKKIVSLDRRTEEDDECGFIEIGREDPNFNESETKDILDHVLRYLNERERIIFRLYNDFDLTFKEIGKRLDLSEAGVWGIYHKSLKKLEKYAHVLEGEVDTTKRLVDSETEPLMETVKQLANYNLPKKRAVSRRRLGDPLVCYSTLLREHDVNSRSQLVKLDK